MRLQVPDIRLRAVNQAPLRDGDFVLYWMLAARRTHFNFALDRAVERACELGKPLLVFEPLRVDHPWASERLHAFVLQGMRDNARRCARAGVAYYPYVEPKPGAARGLLNALAARASLVVTDDQAGFFLPRMISAAGEKLGVRLEAVDGVGLLPVRATDRAFARAVDFRRFLQRNLLPHLAAMPRRDPLRLGRDLPRLAEPPAEVLARFPAASPALLSGAAPELARLPFAASVAAGALPGGPEAGNERLARFIEHGLSHYDDRRHPDLDGASGLSPYLHFGHVGAHEVWRALALHEGWSADAVSERAVGQKERFWGLSAQAEAFVDELVTWRELGHNFCAHRPDFDQYDSLPAWARATLEAHASDPRPIAYSLEQLEGALTHDPVWNAAQRQLCREGVMHNYLRMLWGKKILEWSASPREALSRMIQLNNKYALDGRDPNSYSGIFWCLGRYDRPWGPERKIFGKIRFMSSDSAAKKLRMKKYLARFGASPRESEAEL